MDAECCRCCGKHLELYSDNPFQLAQIHEEPSRAQGGDPLDPKQTLTLCAVCHNLRTVNKLRLEIVDPIEGCRGEVRFLHDERSEHVPVQKER